MKYSLKFNKFNTSLYLPSDSVKPEVLNNEKCMLKLYPCSHPKSQ